MYHLAHFCNLPFLGVIFHLWTWGPTDTEANSITL